MEFFDSLGDLKTSVDDFVAKFGVPKLPILNHISPARERLYAICTEYDTAGTAELGCSEVSDLTI